MLPYIYRHGFGKEVNRISNHRRTLFGYGGRPHGTNVMEESSCLYRAHSSHFRRNIWNDTQHLMDTISGNNKAMSKILVMAEALEKRDEVYGHTA